MSTKTIRTILFVLLVLVVVRRNFSIPLLPSFSEGSRVVVMSYEFKTRPPAQSRLEASLRSGDAQKYLEEKKHTLTIIDNDLPSPELSKWGKELGDDQDGMLIISPPETVLYKGERPKSVSEFMDVLKKHGG